MNLYVYDINTKLYLETLTDFITEENYDGHEECFPDMTKIAPPEDVTTKQYIFIKDVEIPYWEEYTGVNYIGQLAMDINTKKIFTIDYIGELNKDHTLEIIPHIDLVEFYIYDNNKKIWIGDESKLPELQAACKIKLDYQTNVIITNTTFTFSNDTGSIVLACDEWNQSKYAGLYVSALNNTLTYPKFIYEGRQSLYLQTKEEVIRLGEQLKNLVDGILIERYNIREEMYKKTMNELIDYYASL